MEALRLYRPLESQVPFHLSMASERVIRGGNRSGKTMTAAVEVAHAATGIPIFDTHGNVIPDKYPRGRPLVIWCIGYGSKHIATPIFRMLFRPGSFHCIKDLETGQLRAWRPWEESDKAREDEVIPAPPLVPSRVIDPKGWGWENKAAQVFDVCRLNNGTEIHAFTSKAAPKQGDKVDLIWIDEDIEDQRHVAEWQARLSDLKGRLIWSAFPHSRNDALVDMSRRAEKQIDREKPDVTEIVLRYSDNPFIDDDEKRKRLEAWDEDEARARDDGEFSSEQVLVYPNFNIKVHGIPRDPDDEQSFDALEKTLVANGFQPPLHWTRYLALDPGHTTSAVLLLAVPPPEEYGEHVVIYDEVYLKRCDAQAMAEAVRSKAAGQQFEAFVIDSHAGRQTPMGFNRTVKQQYSAAFSRCGLMSYRSGASFIDGSDNVEAGIGLVREALLLRESGTPKLRLVTATTQSLQMEFRNYRKSLVAKTPSDTPIKRHNHALDALRYALSISPDFQQGRAGATYQSPAYREFQEWQKARKKDQSGKHFNFGPAYADSI